MGNVIGRWWWVVWLVQYIYQYTFCTYQLTDFCSGAVSSNIFFELLNGNIFLIFAFAQHPSSNAKIINKIVDEQ